MLRHANIMPSVAPNAQYNVAAADSLPVKIAAHQRRKMFARFLADTGATENDTVLDVGATSERTYEASNYLEAWYPYKDRMTALGLDDASFLPTLYPGMRFVQADALALPFADGAFDIVHAAAVIEHVGAFARQSGLLRECCRVARHAVFVTTPNRWFPIEFHTVLPVVHWLPKPLFRDLMRRTGRGFFAEEANLN
jgi:ubiquinone/menaquinone biosynthesis C-methylase UbiE